MIRTEEQPKNFYRQINFLKFSTMEKPIKSKITCRKSVAINLKSSASQVPENIKRKKPVTASKTSLYDGKGKIRQTQRDICDCFEKDCPGCYFECSDCFSTKCGLQCRRYRRFHYDSIEYDGKNRLDKIDLTSNKE